MALENDTEKKKLMHYIKYFIVRQFLKHSINPLFKLPSIHLWDGVQAHIPGIFAHPTPNYSLKLIKSTIIYKNTLQSALLVLAYLTIQKSYCWFTLSRNQK